MEDLWLGWAKRIQALASTGVHFAASEFDRERYVELADIANSMLASIGDVPIERITDLIPDFGEGYVTPRIDVRAAVIREDTILLVQEKLDNLWTLPGGFADVGLSAAANTEKEVLEEANLKVRANRLYGLFHKARHNYLADTRDFYKMYFICDQLEAGEPAPGAETKDAGFFPLAELPPLSTGRVIESHIALAFQYLEEGRTQTYFD